MEFFFNAIQRFNNQYENKRYNHNQNDIRQEHFSHGSRLPMDPAKSLRLSSWPPYTQQIEEPFVPKSICLPSSWLGQG
jgi:hypothetical protein